MNAMDFLVHGLIPLSRLDHAPPSHWMWLRAEEWLFIGFSFQPTIWTYPCSWKLIRLSRYYHRLKDEARL